jgi:hypothetical protein
VFLGDPERPMLLGQAVRALERDRGIDLDQLALELRFGRRLLESILAGQLAPDGDGDRDVRVSAGATGVADDVPPPRLTLVGKRA